MRPRNFSTFAIALLVGAAAGYCLRTDSGSAGRTAEETASAPVKAAAPAADCGEGPGARALRARVRELEKRLADLGEASGTEPRAAGESRREGRRGAPDLKEAVERMRREDPERFAQMTNGFARMRQDRRSRAQGKLDFLAAVDTSRMSASARKTHADLQDMIVRRDELESRMGGFLEMDEDERRAVFDEMREVHGRIAELNRAERANLLDEVAASIGLSGDEAAELTQTIRDIYEVTESRWGGHGHGGRDTRGRDGGGRR